VGSIPTTPAKKFSLFDETFLYCFLGIEGRE